jgi:hypothetical protein
VLKTYTLYLRDGRDRVRFEPAMCRTNGEAMARARELLELHGECEAVEVFFGDDFLYRVARAPA